MDDFVVDGNISYQILLTGTSSDPAYNRVLPSVGVTNVDNDAARVSWPARTSEPSPASRAAAPPPRSLCRGMVLPTAAWSRSAGPVSPSTTASLRSASSKRLPRASRPSGFTATVTLPDHGYVTGQMVLISGAQISPGVQRQLPDHRCRHQHFHLLHFRHPVSPAPDGPRRRRQHLHLPAHRHARQPGHGDHVGRPW